MGAQDSGLIVTGVDKLIDLLKKFKQLELSVAAKKLGYPPDIVQSWVDFLVEEKLVGVDYKLTKPVIYLLENAAPTTSQIDLSAHFSIYKEDFLENIKKREKDPEKITSEWKEHLVNRLELMKHFFFVEADKRNLRGVEKLWEEYKTKITNDKNATKNA